ncbi:MAG TPA: thioesterase family protein [Candidatus Dormibacteraeota bacterium]
MTSRRYEFDVDTAVEALGGNRFRAFVSPGYSIGPYPNGGYILALAVAATGRVTSLPDPLAVSAHFVRPCAHGRDVEIDVEMVREGRSYATLVARLQQNGSERVRVLATYGDLTAATGETVELGAPPALPPPESCLITDLLPVPPPNALEPTIRHRFEARYHPGTLGWRRPEGRTGRGEVGGYLRFADGREPDVHALVLIADAMPPAVFDMAPGGWVPTLEFTVHIRARPSPGWLRLWFRTRHLRDGHLEEDGEVWDSAGRLVAQSRQLARLNRPQAAE